MLQQLTKNWDFKMRADKKRQFQKGALSKKRSVLLNIHVFTNVKAQITGSDPAFVIRAGPNSEHFLWNLRKLLKKGKFFLTTKSLIVKRNLSLHKPISKNLFLIKKRLFSWYCFGWFPFKNKARGGSGNFEKGGGELIWLDMVYFMIILVKRGR